MIRRKWKIVLIAVIAILIVVRIALPIVMLKKANEFLAGYSKVFTAHIGDIDLSFVRMAYRMENIEMKWRKDNFELLQVGSVDVSLAWRELIRGVILTDIYIDDARVKASPEAVPAFKAIAAENAEKEAAKTPEEREEDKEQAETIKSKFFPLRIERIVVKESSLELFPERDAAEEKRFLIDQAKLRVSNVSPLKKTTKTVATFEARVMKNAQLKGVAQARINAENVDWDVDAEMRGFQLKQANPFLMDYVPFSFTAGTLDLFAEAKSEKGAIIGYVKPFLTKVDVIARKEKFKNTKQFLAEIAAAVGNVLVQRPKMKSVATKVDFSKAGPGADFKVDALGALSNAVEHRLDQPIAPSVEDEIILK